MRSQRPYLLRALYEWIVDSETTPYLLVKATHDGVVVPMEFVQDGQIVLNVSPNAVRDFNIGNDAIAFDGRFGGRSFNVWVPLAAIAAIYAKENGQGMMFDRNDSPAAADESSSEQAGSSNEQVQGDEPGEELVPEAVPGSAAGTGGSSKGTAKADSKPDTPTSGGRGHLKVVK